jgi:hypothetical protein
MVIAALAIVTGSANARADDKDNQNNGKNGNDNHEHDHDDDEVEICHHDREGSLGKTLTVHRKDVPAHQRHHDELGSCPVSRRR